MHSRVNNLKRRIDCLPFFVGIAVTLCAFATHGATGPGGTAPLDNPDDSSNPYSIIVERNVFHLNPPPPPPEPEKPKVELPDVKINGLMTVGTTTKVLFTVTRKDGKKETMYASLAQGQTSEDGKLQLVKIYPEKDKFDVMNDGVLATLTLKDNSSTPESTPAPPSAAPHPVPPAPGVGMPGRPMFPGRALPPGMPGMPGGPGFSFPARARRNLQ